MALPWTNKISINHLTSETRLSLKNLKLYIWFFIFSPVQNKKKISFMENFQNSSGNWHLFGKQCCFSLYLSNIPKKKKSFHSMCVFHMLTLFAQLLWQSAESLLLQNHLDWMSLLCVKGSSTQECCFLEWHNGELMHGGSFTYNTPLIHFCVSLFSVVLGLAHGLLVFLKEFGLLLNHIVFDANKTKHLWDVHFQYSQILAKWKMKE